MYQKSRKRESMLSWTACSVPLLSAASSRDATVSKNDSIVDITTRPLPAEACECSMLNLTAGVTLCRICSEWLRCSTIVLSSIDSNSRLYALLLAVDAASLRNEAWA